jgi:hypothetical protein
MALTAESLAASAPTGQGRGWALRPGLVPVPSRFRGPSTPANPGARRLRVAKGRGAAPDLVVEEPLEDYELTIWPDVG